MCQALGWALGIKCQKGNKGPLVAIVNVDGSQNKKGMEFEWKIINLGRHSQNE